MAVVPEIPPPITGVPPVPLASPRFVDTTSLVEHTEPPPPLDTSVVPLPEDTALVDLPVITDPEEHAYRTQVVEEILDKGKPILI